MSHVMNVYSPRTPPLLKEELKAELERQGYIVAFYAGTSTRGEMVSQSGPFDSSTKLAACKAASENAERFQMVVAAGDMPALIEMINALQVEWCEISSQVPYDISDSWGEDEIEELMDDYDCGPEYVEALRRAKSEYAFSTSLFFDDFMEKVWRAVGSIVGGILDDSERGVIEFVTAREA